MLPTSAVGQSPFGQRLSGNDVLSQRDLGSADIGAPLVKLSNHYNPSCRNGRVRKTEVTSGFSSLHNLVHEPSTKPNIIFISDDIETRLSKSVIAQRS